MHGVVILLNYHPREELGTTLYHQEQTPEMPDPQKLLEIARAGARAAVAVHREHLGKVRPDQWAEKQASDFVTFVDREAEVEIVDLVRNHFPEHAILAEEGTGAAPDGAPTGGTAAGAARAEAGPNSAPAGTPDWLWVIDPLDGTTNYLHRYPMYAASVAVLYRGEPVAGAVISGATGEEWTAHKGGGAFLNGTPIRVSEVERLPHALIGTGFPFKSLEQLPRYLRQFDAILRQSSGIRRAGSAALDLCHLASGYFDGFWELILAPWDIAAGTLIVREAGGVVTSLTGELDLLAGGAVLAGNPLIHAALGKVLNDVA
jgi:myo-inositol-1(or 4)-monophosphatase